MPTSNGNFAPPSAFRAFWGYLIFKLMGGWTMVGDLPRDIPKYVIIVAQHTSNWDFFLGVAVKAITGLRIRFYAKHSLFFWPLGLIMRGLGGVPIERSKSTNRVDASIAQIKNADYFVLGIAPEGTRSKVQRWKTGFYHIACGANVPVVPLALDFKAKQVLVGEPITLTKNAPEDFEKMHAFFLNHPGKHADQGFDGPFETHGVYDHIK